jgi:hypothetical protein
LPEQLPVSSFRLPVGLVWNMSSNADRAVGYDIRVPVSSFRLPVDLVWNMSFITDNCVSTAIPDKTPATGNR